MVVGKKGWLKLAEAGFAIVLLGSVLLVLYINNVSVGSSDEELYMRLADEVLEKIAGNETLRTIVLQDNTESIQNFVEDEMGIGLQVAVEICDCCYLGGAGGCGVLDYCIGPEGSTVENYVRERAISSASGSYAPKKVILHICSIKAGGFEGGAGGIIGGGGGSSGADIGESCLDTSDCQAGLSCLGFPSTCSSGGLGESCTDSSNCNVNLDCHVLPGFETCYGWSTAGVCSSDGDCFGSLQCYDGNCVDGLSSECSSDDDCLIACIGGPDGFCTDGFQWSPCLDDDHCLELDHTCQDDSGQDLCLP